MIIFSLSMNKASHNIMQQCLQKGMWWIICYFCTIFKQLVSMQDEDSFDSTNLKAFPNKSQVACFCVYAMFLNAKRMKFKTNLVFWICLVVACGFMESLKGMAVNKFRKPSIFWGGKVCNKLSSLLMVNAEKWNAKLEEGGQCQLGIA